MKTCISKEHRGQTTRHSDTREKHLSRAQGDIVALPGKGLSAGQATWLWLLEAEEGEGGLPAGAGEDLGGGKGSVYGGGGGIHVRGGGGD